MTRVRIAEFGIIQKALASASVTFYETDTDGTNTGVKATIYQASTGSGTRSNPQTLDTDGKLAVDCYVDAAVMAAISNLSSLTERSIKKIRENPLEFSLPVTSANFASEAAGDLYGDLSAIDAAVAAVEAVLADAGFIAVSTDLLGADTIGTVAGIAGAVSTVAGNTTNINTVAAANAAISTVATNIANVNLVGASIASVNSVAAALTNINLVASDLTNINIVAGDHAIITTVAGDHAIITTVAADHAIINTVAGDHASIVTVAGDHAAIVAVAADHAAIVAVNAALTNINTVATNITSVNTVATNIATIIEAAANIPKANRTATTDPTTGDDTADGYSEASIWVNTTTNQVFFCGDPALGAAVWVNVTAASSLSALSDVTLTGAAAGDMLKYDGAAWINRTAANTRTDLGLVIGTNVQAYDAELAAIAGLVSAADRLAYFTGSGTASLATFTAGGRALINSAGTADTFPYFSASNTVTLGSITTAGRAILDDADNTAQRTTLGLIIGTDVQAYDAELAALAGLTSAANKIPVFTGSGTAGLISLTASTLAGMGSSGNATAITLGTNLSMAAGVLNASGGASDIDGLSDALYDITTGHNLVLGTNTAFGNAGAQFNIFIGEGAGKPGSATAATDNNTGIGYQSMNALTTGDSNTAVGFQTLKAMTDGTINTAVGYKALLTLVSSSQNTAIGYGAIQNCYDGTNTGNNTAVGVNAMKGSATAANNIGINNVAVGAGAMIGMTSADSTVAIGASALNSLTSGDNNTAVGSGAGQTGTAITSGGSNTLVGCDAQVNSATSSNRGAFGKGAIATLDNVIQMGDSSTTAVYTGTASSLSNFHGYNTPKAMAKVTGANGARSVARSINVSSVTDTGVGDITLNFTVSFADSSYIAICQTERSNTTAAATNSRDVNIKSGSQAVGACGMQCWDKTATTNVLKDPTAWHFAAMGSDGT